MKQIVTVKDSSTIEYREKIGKAIREIREKRGYSQDELAER
jgi:ribosome-binding protein aMBF1 (putative translation factor)